MGLNTLIIYDMSGVIFYQASGDVIAPDGIPHKWVDVPEGKRIVSVDVQTDNVIFEDVPKDEMAVVKDELVMVKAALDDVILNMGGGL